MEHYSNILKKLDKYNAKYKQENNQTYQKKIDLYTQKSSDMLYKNNSLKENLPNTIGVKNQKGTRNNNYTVKLPRMKTNTGLHCVAVAGGKIFNDLPLDARKIDSRIIFTSFLNEHFS